MNLGVTVITEQFALGNAASAFAPDGALLDGKQAAAVKNVIERLAFVAGRLGG
jgi:hypothetical protein